MLTAQAQETDNPPKTVKKNTDIFSTSIFQTFNNMIDHPFFLQR